ncbi:MAG TPA: hypothetical protein VGB40_00815, partial [Rubrobacteraceae bacterium]
YRDEELRRSVDTEYGERAESPERPTERSSLGRTRGDNLDIPLDDPGRTDPHDSPPSERTAERSGDLTSTGQTRRTDEGPYTDVEVQGDRNVRVYKRTRTVRG